MKLTKQFSKSTIIFSVISAIYLLLSFFLPVNNTLLSTYSLTAWQYRYLLFVVKLPIVLVWVIAFISYRRLHNYTQKLDGSPEGIEFTKLSEGLKWLAWGLPVPGLISSVLTSFAHSGAPYSATLIVTNYLYVVGSIVAFSYISSATNALSERSKVRLSTKHIRLLVCVFVAFSVLLSFLIASRLHGERAGDSYNAFYLPVWMVWVTIIGPYLYAWFIGLYAALELIIVARRTSGIIYRQALQLLAFGVTIIICAMVMLQYFRSIVPRTGHITISGALIASYAIYAVYATGWILLIVGSHRLKRIEDV